MSLSPETQTVDSSIQLVQNSDIGAIFWNYDRSADLLNALKIFLPEVIRTIDNNFEGLEDFHSVSVTRTSELCLEVAGGVLLSNTQSIASIWVKIALRRTNDMLGLGKLKCYLGEYDPSTGKYISSPLHSQSNHLDNLQNRLKQIDWYYEVEYTFDHREDTLDIPNPITGDVLHTP